MRIQHPTIYLIRHFSNSIRGGDADAAIVQTIALAPLTQP
jgi:hypothetical protein